MTDRVIRAAPPPSVDGSTTSGRRSTIRFVGSKAQGLQVARALAAAPHPWQLEIITLDDRDDGRSVLRDFEALAAERALPCTVVRTRRAARAAMAGPVDVTVVVGWYWLLDREERASSRLGVVGLHHSLLPRYRGGAPLVWAIMQGEQSVGTTLFSIDDGMDEGDIWGQVSVSVGAHETVGDVLQRLEPEATRMLVEVLPGILDGTRTAQPQRHEDATFGAQRIADDGVIDWRQPAQRVHDFIRAQSRPYPGAFTYLHGRRLIVWRSGVASGHWHATPGQVIAVNAPVVRVACGDGGVLELHDVEYEGATAQAADVIRTRAVRFPQVPLVVDQAAGGLA